MTLWTVGHSNRTMEQFLSLLQAHGVELLVDIRTAPGSRRNPQFNGESLAESLAASGIGYVHLRALGGLRRPRPDSTNLAWRNPSFRGYADYMQTEAFERALSELMDMASRRRTAVMCAEAVPWRCHRSLVADALTARGVEVQHILSPEKASAHKLTPFAQVEGMVVSYPATPLLDAPGEL